jgi:tetratricopeptide (TPR) repeat protein
LGSRVRHGVPLLLVAFFLVGCETGVPTTEVAGLYYNLGNAYFELNEFGSAVTAYLNALELDSKLPQAGYNLARVYIESGDVDKGVTQLEELLAEDPENSVILSTIGWAYYLLNDYESSYEVYRRILDRTPSDENGLYNAAVVAWLLDAKTESLAYYQRLYAESGDDEILYRIASIYLDLELWSDAIGTLTEYTALEPEDSDAFYDLGVALTADRLYGEALEAFDRAIELQTDNPVFLFEKAVILLRYIENLDEGLKFLGLAVDGGFADSERAAALATVEGLPYQDEVRDFLIEKNLITDDPPLDEGPEETVEEGDIDVPESDTPARDSPTKSGKTDIGAKTELPPAPEETSEDAEAE